MEQQWNDTDREKSNDLKKYLSNCHYAHQKSHINSLSMNLALCGEKPAIN
jgi:hypothetical protein